MVVFGHRFLSFEHSLGGIYACFGGIREPRFKVPSCTRDGGFSFVRIHRPMFWKVMKMIPKLIQVSFGHYSNSFVVRVLGFIGFEGYSKFIFLSKKF